MTQGFSPEKVRIALEAQIEKRIDHDSPTKYDINFYVRKINRLQSDLNLVQEELSNARIRLRRAEDFEIKYDLVLKQNNSVLAENDKLVKEIQALRVQLERTRLKWEHTETVQGEFIKEKNTLLAEVQNYKQKYQRSEELRLQETSAQQGQVEHTSRRDLDNFKKEAAEREDRYETQIRQLKKIIAEKQTIENVVGMKVDRIRKEKDEEIARLNGIIDKQRADFQQTLQEKNEDLEKLQAKYEKMIEYEIDNIKINLDSQDQMFSIEINGLREILGLKNDEILKLLGSLRSQSEQFERERDVMKDEIKTLKDKVYKSERESELQLYNVKERLTKIHAEDIEALQAKYNDVLNALKADKSELDQIVRAKELESQQEQKEMQRVKQECADRIKEKDHRIKQLIDKLREVGDVNVTEMRVLHESFHKIESEKEAMATGYQENISFLDQQIKKLAASLQLKNGEIKTLQDDIAHLKRTSQQQIHELEMRLRKERKEREDERDKDRSQVERLDEEWRMKQRQWRAKERTLERDRDREERQKKKQTYIAEEFEKDNARLNGYIKQLDEALKRELKKNQLSTLDAGGIRREMVAELQKQKADLEAVKRMEVDQATKKLEIEISRLNSLNQKLQTDLQAKSIALQNQEADMKKLESINKNVEKINKDKLIEYQRKMATLNSEINLTQHLYQNFVEAKSRLKKQNIQP